MRQREEKKNFALPTEAGYFSKPTNKQHSLRGGVKRCDSLNLS